MTLAGPQRLKGDVFPRSLLVGGKGIRRRTLHQPALLEPMATDGRCYRENTFTGKTWDGVSTKVRSQSLGLRSSSRRHCSVVRNTGPF